MSNQCIEHRAPQPYPSDDSTIKSFDFRIIGKLVLETIPNLYYSTQYFIDLCYRIVKFIVGKESIIVTPHPCAEEVWGKMVILINIKFRS